MKYLRPNYLKHCIQSIFYAIVLIGFSSVYAGSYDDFFSAIQRDDAVAVSNLLKRGFDVNTVNPNGEHGLFLALSGPSIKVLPVLIAARKVNLDPRNAHDESPLMLAALKGLTEVCKQLIDVEADINKPGWAPLHYASTHGHIDIMYMLLEHSAYIDAASPNGSTPLMMARQYGTPQAVKLLLESGADPSIKNALGLTALDFAVGGNKPDSADIIRAFLRAK